LVEDGIPTKFQHQTLVEWFLGGILNEKFQHGIPTKLWCQSLVKDTYVELSPNFGNKVCRCMKFHHISVPKKLEVVPDPINHFKKEL
jgi:hypothetical protein